MVRLINSVISICVTWLKLGLLKLFHGSHIKYCFIERFSPNVDVVLENGGSARFGNRVRIHSGSKLRSVGKGVLTFEDNVHLNYNCMVVCHESITIGAGTTIGPSVMIYDHDHDFSEAIDESHYKTAPVAIGKNCWIGANAIILRGSEIGDGCVIAADTVVKGKFPAGSLVYNKRETVCRPLNK